MRKILIILFFCNFERAYAMDKKPTDELIKEREQLDELVQDQKEASLYSVLIGTCMLLTALEQSRCLGIVGNGLTNCWFGCSKYRKKLKIYQKRQEIVAELERRETQPEKEKKK